MALRGLASRGITGRPKHHRRNSCQWVPAAGEPSPSQRQPCWRWRSPPPPSRRTRTTCSASRTPASSACRPTRPTRRSPQLVGGEIVGFDIDVGREIATRLGVELALETPDWALITAGSWDNRWDFSVGSMTITSKRQEVLDFTQPYYFTPAQMSAHADAGVETLDDLAGKTICMGEATTYLEWMNGTLDFGTESPDTVPPEGSLAVTRLTDRDCAQEWGWVAATSTAGSPRPRRRQGRHRRWAAHRGRGRACLLRAARRPPSTTASRTTTRSWLRSTPSSARCTRTARSPSLAMKWFGEDLTKRVDE